MHGHVIALQPAALTAASARHACPKPAAVAAACHMHALTRAHPSTLGHRTTPLSVPSAAAPSKHIIAESHAGIEHRPATHGGRLDHRTPNRSKFCTGHRTARSTPCMTSKPAPSGATASCARTRARMRMRSRCITRVPLTPLQVERPRQMQTRFTRAAPSYLNPSTPLPTEL